SPTGAAAIYIEGGEMDLINSIVTGNTSATGKTSYAIKLGEPNGNLTTALLVGDTIAGNAGPGVFGYGTIILRNDTIVGNAGSGVVGKSRAPLLTNTVVWDNAKGNSIWNFGDVRGAVNSASSNNVIGNGDYLTGISDGAQGNQIGSAQAGSVIYADLGPPAD